MQQRPATAALVDANHLLYACVLLLVESVWLTRSVHVYYRYALLRACDLAHLTELSFGQGKP